MSSAANWPPDLIKNAIRSARTFAVYNVPVSIMTMKIRKREIDPSDMKVGERRTSQAIEPAIFWSLELCELVQNRRTSAGHTYNHSQCKESGNTDINGGWDSELPNRVIRKGPNNIASNSFKGIVRGENDEFYRPKYSPPLLNRVIQPVMATKRLLWLST